MKDKMTPREMAYLSLAIGEALVDDEDRLYWAAGAAIGNTLGLVPSLLPGVVEESNRWNVELFSQIASSGEVHLPDEYKAFITKWLKVCYSQEALDASRAQFRRLFG